MLRYCFELWEFCTISYSKWFIQWWHHRFHSYFYWPVNWQICPQLQQLANQKGSRGEKCFMLIINQTSTWNIYGKLCKNIQMTLESSVCNCWLFFCQIKPVSMLRRSLPYQLHNSNRMLYPIVFPLLFLTGPWNWDDTYHIPVQSECRTLYSDHCHHF